MTAPLELRHHRDPEGETQGMLMAGVADLMWSGLRTQVGHGDLYAPLPGRHLPTKEAA